MPVTRRTRALVLSGSLFLAGPVLPFALRSPAGSSRRRGVPAAPPLPPDPLVEVVLPAYLEVGTVGPTVRALARDLSLAGVRHVVTVVASDDGTARAAAAAGASVLVTERRGKPAAIDAAVERSTADVIVLSDANCEFLPADWPTVMLDELRSTRLLSANKTETGSPDGLFWRFESLVKRRAGAATLSVVGEFLAFRRGDFRPVPAGTTSDDVWMAIDFDARGLPVSVSPTIVTREVGSRGADQWERRVRIAEGQLREALPRLGTLVRTPAGRQYAAHKLYRLTVGAAAFWVAVGAFASLRPRITVPLTTLPLLLAVLQYRGVLRAGTRADPVLALPALQTIPIAAAVRVARRRLGRAESTPGWRKVSR